jgi:hypothetical protein
MVPWGLSDFLWPPKTGSNSLAKRPSKPSNNQRASHRRPIGLNRPPPLAGSSSRRTRPARQSKIALKDLNFKVKPDLHYAFKMIAARRDMKMKDLLKASLRAWIDAYGDDDDRELMPLP